jgi:hypothetical protein
VNLNKSVFQPKDTIYIEAQYFTTTGKRPPATLEIKITDEAGRSARYRWPLLKGAASSSLFLPDSLSTGKYTMTFAIQKEFFSLKGKIISLVKTPSLDVTLLTKAADIVTATIPVSEQGTFSIKNWVFDDEATLMLARTDKKYKGDLDIELETLLDSTFHPLLTASREFYVGSPPSDLVLDTNGKRRIMNNPFTSNPHELENITIKAQTKTLGQKFDAEFSGGLFRNVDERLFDIMSDPNATNYATVLSYLQGKVAGLTITQSADGTEAATWRGDPVSMFVDEVPAGPDRLAFISMYDIAIIKTYPPIFMGAPNAKGGGIAIYTRRGNREYAAKSDRHIFRIKGFSPSTTALVLQ